jgi:hypothetical protein
LKHVQHRDKILAINEFAFPFPHFDILPKEGVVNLRLQGFEVVNIIGLNLNLTRTRDLALLVIHTGMCTTVQVWLKTRDGVRGWTTTARHQHIYYFFFNLYPIHRILNHLKKLNQYLG